MYNQTNICKLRFKQTIEFQPYSQAEGKLKKLNILRVTSAENSKVEIFTYITQFSQLPYNKNHPHELNLEFISKKFRDRYFVLLQKNCITSLNNLSKSQIYDNQIPQFLPPLYQKIKNCLLREIDMFDGTTSTNLKFKIKPIWAASEKIEMKP